MLESIFSKLLIMSVQAGVLVFVVLLIRGICKRIPRKYICLLWCMVALRLLLPVSIESDYSLMPAQGAIEEIFSAEVAGSETVQQEATIEEAASEQVIALELSAAGNGGITPEQKDAFYEEVLRQKVKDSVLGSSVAVKEPASEKQTFDPKQLVITLWLLGMLLLLGYGAFTFIKLSIRVRDAVHSEGNLWLSDRIDTPFLLGFIKPRIYMPFFVDESRREYIIAHENGHIQRGDHITKLIGYVLLSVYWFQPLVWVAYVLFCKDVEMACDEKVIGSLGEERKKDYSQTLLLCSVEKHYMLANPLAFGEIDVKKRITNVLSYKKPGVILSILSVVVLVIVAVFFMTSGKDAELSGTTLSVAQEKYLATLADGTKYAVIPMKNSEEPLLLTTNDDWENHVFESDTDSITMYSYINDIGGTIATTGIPCELRWDEDGLYQADEIGITLLHVDETVNAITGKPMLIATNCMKEEEGYEKLHKQFEKAATLVWDVVDNISAENQVMTDAQLQFMQGLESDEQLIFLPLEGAGEPLLLAAAGVYKDPAFDNAEVSFAAKYCIFGQEGSISTGGTAYPIRGDYEAIYLESGDYVTVLSVAEENREKYLEQTVYTKNDKEYPEILDKCHLASVVDFNIRLSVLQDDITEHQKQMIEELNALVGVETEVPSERRAMEDIAEQIKAELDALEAKFDSLKTTQRAQEAFENKYGAPVRMGECTSTAMAEEIALKMFTEYMKMDNLYASSLPGDYHGERYWQVELEGLSTAEGVYDHIRSLSTQERAQVSYNNLFTGEAPLLKEENGKLYTTAYDSIPTLYEQYTEVTVHDWDEPEVVYTISPKQAEEEMASFYVRCVREDDNWVVAECAPLMSQGSHEMYPETVHSTVDMGEYQAVLQDYTFADGPLEVAVLRDGTKETLTLLYEEWQRDPSKVRIAKAEDVLGYDAFYVYDFGLVFNLITEYYALADGEIVQIAEAWGYDPEEGHFSLDEDGDGINELFCNLFYSGDGGQAVYVYKRDGERILRGFLECGRFEESEDAIKAEVSAFDGERDKAVVSEYKENSIETHYLDLDKCNIAYREYIP